VEGVSDVDKEIESALALCEGFGYGAMCMSGTVEWEPNGAKTGRRAELGSKSLKAEQEALLAAKNKLVAIETSLLPKKKETNSNVTNAKEKTNEGTLLSLYSRPYITVDYTSAKQLCSRLTSAYSRHSLFS
jgi:hypothetical protein